MQRLRRRGIGGSGRPGRVTQDSSGPSDLYKRPTATARNHEAVQKSLTRTGRKRLVTTAAVLLLAVVGVLLLPSTTARLGSGGMTAASAESVRAETLLKERFPAANPDLILLLTPAAGDTAAARSLVEEVAGRPGVTRVHSYFTDLPVDELRSGDTGLAFVTVRAGTSPAELLRIAEDARDAGRGRGVTVAASGDGVIDGSIDALAEKSLVRAELIAAPLVGLILLVVFGSVWAALMPLVAGGAAVSITLLGLNLLARVTEVSTFALNLATAIGFGLAVDYALFIIARWRESRLLGMTAEEARAVTVRTSGRTIVFSGITVAIAMAALLIFPGYFLKSLAYSGILTVTTVMLVTVVIVPWMLVALDQRAVHRYSWSRWAAVEHDPSSVTVRPAPGRLRVWISALLIAGVLLVAAAPFLRADFVLRDYRELPAGDLARAGTQQLVDGFPELSGNSVNVVFPAAPEPAALSAVAEQIARIDEVRAVRWAGGTVAGQADRGQTDPGHRDSGQTDSATAFDRALFGAPDGQSWLRVDLAADPESPRAAAAVRGIRGVVAQHGGLAGGPTAALVDSTAGIAKHLPYALAAIVLVTAVLLFLLTGSVVLPLIGVALSVLSLGATFGSLVFVFSDGHFAEVLGGFTAFGAINVTAPILLFCIAYGLSMDYQMFILSRIAEERAAGRSSEGAIQVGIAATRRVIGAAAILIAVVLAAMATSGLTYLKILGLGLAVAVLVDAFVVRLYLLPNAMRLFGDAVWYRPGWLHPVYRRFRLSHGDRTPEPGDAAEPGDGGEPGHREPGRGEPIVADGPGTSAAGRHAAVN